MINALIYLCAAIIAVPLAKRAGLGAVLGYLLAGVLIGPYALSLVGDQTDVMHVAEFGVVMMLFLIGLELQPSRLWDMRRPILGLGGLQVVLSAGLITLLVMAVSDLDWRSALAIGLALALSSTAIVLQSLQERGLLNTPAGNNTFSVLLFQDIAIIPILALLPLLSNVASSDSPMESHSLIESLPASVQVFISLTTIAAVILAGRFLAAPIFRKIAETDTREIFTAFALFIVVAITVLMQSIGLSPALGAFIAGVVLADCEYRHEIEADIEPFKGLLLGLFFITVGAGIDFDLLLDKPVVMGLSVVGLVAAKLLVLMLLAAIFKMGKWRGLLFSLALAQGGEFAFVIVAAANANQVFSPEVGDLVILVVALSMLLTPLLLAAYETLFSRTGRKKSTASFADESIPPSEHVIIAGYGRFGQIIGRLLSAQGYQLTILDHSPGQVELVRRFGSQVYYGDASRKDLLRAAGGDQATLLIVAVDEPERAMRIVDTAQRSFPHLKILVRAIDRSHAYKLIAANVTGLRRETFHSALKLGVDALKELGLSTEAAERAGQLFETHDENSLRKLARVWGDDKSYGRAIRKNLDELRRVLQEDAQKRRDEDSQ
ncbi:monovalent cation:proton antiporter-2 (CPA2) family protein [Gilvimarinus xylanilyticus]|uniref:Monovalent cation:proton antiporter-2 (CPA2) family protein n=1 Tax=Gilvimarinus xylanilyticus TaxID=2944139 RepID=A0A9X2I3D3_9GAMM|nr:monovalent cation:proton antiporter-2 (CPA2) family protein [Gilvimarinus xylanilyticus]MCP8900083.1 monovalent cation:proton antiporter-2 (CPA2) family protein [Gilvimarinus xylanilyticus]